MAYEHLRYELTDRTAVITMDDGKANALSHAMIDALQEALERAEREASAVILTGRPGRLSGGFDLPTMMASPASARALVGAGAELMLRIYLSPRPVVVACTGHALAAGAIMLLVGDTRLGAAGDYKIGLNEVAIGLTLPIFATELARDRLSKRHFSAAVTQARIFDPEGAHDAGFVDQVVAADALQAAAAARAVALGALPDPAFRNTKRNERSATVKLIRETLTADLEALTRLPTR